MKTSEKVIWIIKDKLSGKTDVGPQDKLQDLNVDSVAFIQIIVALESEFGFEFEDEKLLFTAFPTVKDMVDYVIDRTGGENNDC